VKLPTFPLSGFDGRMPVASNPYAGARHKGVDLCFRALSSDPKFAGRPDAQRTKLFFFPPPGIVVVRAAGAGIVTISHERGNGGSVRVLHPGGISTLYLHLAERLVDVGQELGAGEPIGTAGGPAPGEFSHLHYEVRGPGETHRDPMASLVGSEVLDNAGGLLGPFDRAGKGRRKEGPDGCS